MVCGRRLSSLRLNLIGLGLFFLKCNPQKGEKGCLRGLIPMHESGVQGRFRVDFHVGPLDLKLPPLPINGVWFEAGAAARSRARLSSRAASFAMSLAARGLPDAEKTGRRGAFLDVR